MPYTLELEDLKNKSKEEIEVQICYLSEENTDLRQKIKTGKQAEEILKKNECRLIQLMDCYLGVGETVNLPKKKYEILKREMQRADSLYGVQKDLKELKDLISRSNYQLDQKEIFRILDNVDKSIEEEM
jgi:ribosomal protein L29